MSITKADLILFFSLLIILLPSTASSFVLDVQQARADVKTIVVPDDCSTIQAAINLADLGDVIYVKAGTYYESIIVNKTLSLVGQSRETTVIDGGKKGTVVTVVVNGVTVTGFTIRQGRIWYPNAGVLLSYANNSKIYGNNILNNMAGIMLSYSSNNTIEGNNIRESEGYGLESRYSSSNNITGNNIESNFGAIELVDSHNNKMLENNVIGNSPYAGIELWDSSNNVLRYNVIDDLEVMGSELAHFINDVDVSNTIEGRPVFYLVNQRNLVITPQTHPQIGFLAVVNSTNITIKHLDIKKTFTGILLAYTANSLIWNVTVTDHQSSFLPIVFSGIRLISATGNRILGNVAVNNFIGIWLERSTNNSIVRNTVTKNTEGIWLQSSSNNSVSENKIENNDEGVLVHPENNLILHNNFLQNRVHVRVDPNYSNLWDDGYPSGGNYWSDYSGIDIKSGPDQDQPGSDGIGDTPYTINPVNVDHYPLMTQYDISPPTVIILSPQNESYGVNTLALAFSVDEATPWMGYSLNGQANVTITGNATLPVLPDGRHYITVYANDTRGNMGISTIYFAVDTTLPKANAGDDLTVNEDTMVTLDALRSSDNLGINTYTWTFTDVDTLQILDGVNPVYTFQTPGIYTLTLNVTDDAGNCATDTLTITVLDVTKPLVNAGSDQTVDEDLPVTLNASGSTDNVGISTYRWTFTDITQKTLTGREPAYTFSTPGAYTITLNATDAAGNWATDTTVITVLDVTEPVANAGQDQTVDTGATVTFDAGSSTDNVAISNYEWDFGDGTTGTGITTNHAYKSPGTYVATLTVRDSAGNYATDSITIKVLAPTGITAWTIGIAVAAITLTIVAVALMRKKRK